MMVVNGYRNAVAKRADGNIVDLEIETDLYGWIPITIDLTDDDQAAHIKQVKGWLSANPGSVAAYVEPPIDNAKMAAKMAIDNAAGAARARYITVAPGQEAVYLLKDREAREYAAAGYPASPVPPLVQADADALGLSPRAAADAIIAQADAWIGIAAQIERERRKGKADVAAAADDAAVTAARDAAIAALGAL